MRIGILTFHYAYNYGGILQAYALQEYLRSKGHSVEFVKYKNKYIKDYYQYINFNRIPKNRLLSCGKYISTSFSRLLFRLIRYKRMKTFIHKYINEASNDSLEQYDLIIVGSDQVWNIDITGGFDSYYWGNVPALKVVSYAASFNKNKISNSLVPEIKRRLLNFNATSVREESLKKIFQPLTDKEIKVVLDPTLLAPPTIWNKFKTNNNSYRKYILVYALRDEQKLMTILKKMQEDVHLEYILLRGAETWKYNKHIKQFANPGDFVSLFQNAEYVVTSSFHGTVFSILFHKMFYTLKCNDGNNSRVESLLKTVGLSDRLVDEYPKDGVSQTIDYAEVDKRLHDYRQQSIIYLDNICK